MSCCKEQPFQPIRERLPVNRCVWLVQILGWRSLALLFTSMNLEVKEILHYPDKPTRACPHNAYFVRNYSNEFTITSIPNRTSLLTRSASYFDIVVKNRDERNLWPIFISFCAALPPAKIETQFSRSVLFYLPVIIHCSLGKFSEANAKLGNFAGSIQQNVILNFLANFADFLSVK